MTEFLCGFPEAAFCFVTALYMFFSNTFIECIFKYIRVFVLNEVAGEQEMIHLGDELRRMKETLGTISPTNEFAAYCKQERLINKFTTHYEAAVEKYNINKRVNDSADMKCRMAAEGFVRLIGLALVLTFCHVQAFCISENLFNPVNHLLHLPSISVGDVCPAGQTPVSMFVVMVAFMPYVVKTYLAKDPQKIHLKKNE